MIRLKNPYAEFPGYSCFGCSPTNPSGLHMEFYKEGEELLCRWDPSEHYQGFHNILHGGIQATMMDEIASWVVFIMLDTAGVTYQLNSRFRQPVLISKGVVTLRASLLSQQKRLAEIEARLYDGEGVLCAESQASYFVFPREKAVSEMHFPGRDAFLNQD
ncbi:MAG: PaaI family thioesterase [Bacteroidales bacterium]|nr:PaaI family thioesterase [Bacteroidales bacterium]